MKTHASDSKVVALDSRGPRFPVRRAASQHPRLIVVDNTKTRVAVIALAAIALIGVGAFADRLFAAPQSFSCFARTQVSTPQFQLEWHL